MRDGFALLDEATQPVGHHPQELVADRVAEGIVDVLEVIEIEQVRGHNLAALGVRDRMLQPLVEQSAIGQSGQGVMVGHMGDLGLRPPLLGDILTRTDRAAVGHRLYRYGNAAPVAELAVELAEMSVIAFAQHGVDDRLRRHIRQQLVANAMSNDLKQRCPKRHLVGGELIDFRIAAIAEDKPLVGIEHGKPLCDVVQCRVQLDILGPQLLFLHFQQVVLLLEACIEIFDLRRRPASFAQIPDCVDLELVQNRTPLISVQK